MTPTRFDWLTVDLTLGRVHREPFRETIRRDHLGGRGINAWLLSRHLPAGIDALAPGNIMVISGGLLTGSAAPSSSRVQIAALSPQTGLLGSSNVGGQLGAALTRAGIGTLSITGRAERPSILWIDGGEVAVREAEQLWGTDSREAVQRLRSELGSGVQVLTIGPGGENLVRFACVMEGTRHAAGRTGMGAVLGSKNLKAIVVRSPRQDRTAASDALSRQAHDEMMILVRRYAERIRSSPRYESYARFSTSPFVTWGDKAGRLPTMNYRHVHFEHAAEIDGARLIDYVTRSHACYNCPVHCKAEVEIHQGRYAGMHGERPDIEPIVNLGARCGLGDPEALLYLFELSSLLGMDSISLGGVLAFAMDLYERKIISADDTGGVQLTWGNAEAMETMMHRIARREGFGAVLAEGVRGAAKLIGRGSAAYAYHTKGLELTGGDPRGGMGTALGYAVSPRGADFASVYPNPEYRWGPEQGKAAFGSESSVDRLSTEGKGRLVKHCMIVSAVLDSIGICKLPVLSIMDDYTLESEAALAAAVTGWELTAQELALAGERTVNLERLFNLSHGMTGADDDLPDHFTEDPVTDPGPTQGMVVAIQPMVRDFYHAMGWDEQGIPERTTLSRLGLRPAEGIGDLRS